MGEILERFKYKTVWRFRKYHDDSSFERGVCFSDCTLDGNILLNEGINLMLTLLTGGAGTAFNNANAYIGVGDSTASESASQTGLQAASNKTYKAMASSYPAISGQTVTFRAVFGSSDANYAWNEFSVANGSNDSTATNLNRKVSSQGTKASGQTWTVDLQITIS